MGIFMCLSANGKFDNVEAEQDCLADLFTAMKRDGYVIVDFLDTHRGERGERVIWRRRSALIGPGRFVSLENATARFVEEVVE